MANELTILQADQSGNYSLKNVARDDIQRIDISDVDLVITAKNGEKYVIPGGGIAAMEDHPPVINFSDHALSIANLLSEVGAVLDTASAVPLPSSIKQDAAKQAQQIEKLQKQVKDLQKQVDDQNQHKQDETKSHDHDQDSVGSLTTDSVGSVEQMVQQTQQVVDALHDKDFDYVPPVQYQPSTPPPAPSGGVPPPISLTPLVTLFMGNIVGTTSSTTDNPGYTTFYGGGGAVGTDAAQQIGPRDPLQFSPAVIDTTGVAGNVIVYADGPAVGNNPTAQNFAYYSKQVILSVAGYFTTLNDVQVSGVPSGVSLVGATNEGGGNWSLPHSYVTSQTPFVILYSTSGTGTFDMTFTITGEVSQGKSFQAIQTIEFEYMPVTNVDQITNPTLVYDSHGTSQEIYVLPTLAQPNIITAGNGNDIIYGGPNTDTITLGNGNNTVTDYNGIGNAITVGSGDNTINIGSGANDVVTAGDGNNAITLGAGSGDVISAGNGNNTITVGGANVTITAGGGSNTITTAGGGGTITAGAGGAGTNAVTINSTSGSTDNYTIALLGTGTNTVTGGDDDYAIALGNATNNVTVGNSTSKGNGVSTFDTTITAGNGNNTITTGSGTHEITIGAAATTSNIEVNGAGNNTFIVNSAANSTADYIITATYGGSTIINTTNGGVANTQGDGDYQILLGNGNSNITLGNSTLNGNGFSTFDTTITTGVGNSTITAGNGTHDITVGTGTTAITVGAGNNTITASSGGGGTITATGLGSQVITTGMGGYTITTSGGGGTFSIGNGSTSDNSLNINAASGRTSDVYNVTMSSSATNTITTGAADDGDYLITVANDTATMITIGNSTANDSGVGSTASNYDTQIILGTGSSNISVGTGDHYISVGAGATNITVSASDTASNYIVSASGGGTITSDGSGVNTITTGAGTYTINATGAGNNTVTVSGSDTITLGNGANSLTMLGTGTNTVTLGNGNNTVSAAGSTGSNSVTVGSGVNTVTLGTNGSGVSGSANTITLNNGMQTTPSGMGSTSVYTLYAAANNAVQKQSGSAGNGNFDITLGNVTGTNTVSIGNGYSQAIAPTSAYTAYDTWILAGTGSSNISVGTGDHYISVGAGATNITQAGTDTGSNYIKVAGGGGTITLADNGTNTITASATGNYTISATGTGNDTIIMAGGSGTITTGNGVDSITVTSGNYTITTGNGHGDSVTAGSGNNTINMGTGGADALTLGSGSSTVNIGLGTSNTITGGAGTDTLNFSALTTPVTIAFGTVTAGSGTASATGASETFSSFTGTTNITGTNYGDTITLGSGNFNITEGSGAGITDTITLGSGTDSLTVNSTTASSINNITLGSGTATVYAGNGTNTITGTNLTTTTNDVLYGGSGNNTYLHPDAGTTYNGTRGAALSTIANNQTYSFTNTTATNPFANATGIPSYVGTSYSGGVETVTLYLNNQLNLINYSNAGSAVLSINLAEGAGLGGTAQSSTYAFTSTSGYSTINGIIGDAAAGDGYTPSFSNTIFIGMYGGNTFYDTGTVSSQIVELVGNNNLSTGGTGVEAYFMGAASEIVVGSSVNNNNVFYNQSGGSPAPIAVNFDSTSHTFSTTLFGSGSVAINAYSGGTWGNLNTGYTNANAWSNGDYFVPVSGTETNINYLVGDAIGDIVYGGSTSLSYQTNGGKNYFFAGSGGSLIYANNYGSASQPDAFVVLTAGGNNIITANNLNSNLYFILKESYDTGTQASKDSTFSTTYGGTTYGGFAYGWGNVSTPTGNFVAYLTGYEAIIGGPANDYFVGDAANDQFNGLSGSNKIILGGGNNIIDALQGTNTISLTTYTGVTAGTNTLNFETTNDAYSGIIASASPAATSGVLVFLNNGTETSFFSDSYSTTNDQAAIWGPNYASGQQVLTGNGDSVVANNIIKLINGSDYASGTTDSATSNAFSYDNVYSGATNIRAHSGNNVFIDNLGTNTENFYAGSGSNIYYVSPSQIASTLTISGTTTSTGDNVLRVEGWGAGASGNAFGSTDPFTSTGAAKNITGINVIDVRSGQDTVTTSTTTITEGAGSTSHTGTYNLSAADTIYVSGLASGSAKVTLLLDSGELFTPTSGQHYYGEGSAAAGANGTAGTSGVNWQYYIGYTSMPTTYGQAGYTAIIDVHYGTGAFSTTGISPTYHASA